MKIFWCNGRKNIIGPNVRILRKQAIPRLNQRQLAEKLQLLGYDFDELTIGRIETGKRFVADYEVQALAKVFDVPIQRLFLDNSQEVSYEKT